MSRRWSGRHVVPICYWKLCRSGDLLAHNFTRPTWSRRCRTSSLRRTNQMQKLRQQSTRCGSARGEDETSMIDSAECIMRINIHRLVLASIAVLGMVYAPGVVAADPAQAAGAQGKVAPLP